AGVAAARGEGHDPEVGGGRAEQGAQQPAVPEPGPLLASFPAPHERPGGAEAPVLGLFCQDHEALGKLLAGPPAVAPIRPEQGGLHPFDLSHWAATLRRCGPMARRYWYGPDDSARSMVVTSCCYPAYADRP